MLPDEEEITVKIKDFDINFHTSFELNEKGFLDPIVYGCEINFGESMITNSNPFMELVYHNFIEFSKVMIENSAWFFGKYMFTHLLGPVLDNFSNHYILPFYYVSELPGHENATEKFHIDFRSV